MGAREFILAAALMAMVKRSMAYCTPCYMTKIVNGTVYPGVGEYCTIPSCDYGLTLQCCCYVCLKGPGEPCGGFRGSAAWIGTCGTGMWCQIPENTNRNPHRYGTCSNNTTPAAKCPSPWFLLNNQCFRVVSGEAELRSSASANAFCGSLIKGSDLAQPKNLTALSDHLRENKFTDSYWLGVTGNSSSDVEDCTELLPGNGLGYGVHHLNDWSCKRKNNFICERHYRQGRPFAGK